MCCGGDVEHIRVFIRGCEDSLLRLLARQQLVVADPVVEQLRAAGCTGAAASLESGLQLPAQPGDGY